MKQDKDKLMRVNLRFINALQTSHFFWDKAFRRVGYLCNKRYSIFFKKNTNEYYEDLRYHLEATYENLTNMRANESIWEFWSIHLKLKVAIRIYSGLRYRFGLPCHGQRTRSNSNTIGYLCRVKVRKNVNYSAQKKKRSEVFSVGSNSKGKDIDSGGFKKESALKTQIYDSMYTDKISFLTSISGFRKLFTSNQLILLNKEFLKIFKSQKGESFQLTRRKKQYRSRAWWVRKQKKKAWSKKIQKQRAYERYVIRFNAKIRQSVVANLQKGQVSLDGTKVDKSKLISFDQFLIPTELRKQRRRRKEERWYRLLDKSLQGIKWKWIYSFFIQKMVVIGVSGNLLEGGGSHVVTHSNDVHHLDVSSCTGGLKKPFTFIKWDKSSLITNYFEKGKDKKEHIQKEKLRLSARRSDQSHLLRSASGGKFVKRSDQARQKMLALKLRKQKQYLQRLAGTKARQGFSM